MTALARRRAVVRGVYRTVHAIQRRERIGLLRAVERLRARIGADLGTWHALSRGELGNVDGAVLERLAMVRGEQRT